MRQLERYAWPGNVRELRNVIERAAILATGPRLTWPLPSSRRWRTSSSNISAPRSKARTGESAGKAEPQTAWA